MLSLYRNRKQNPGSPATNYLPPARGMLGLGDGPGYFRQMFPTRPWTASICFQQRMEEKTDQGENAGPRLLPQVWHKHYDFIFLPLAVVYTFKKIKTARFKTKHTHGSEGRINKCCLREPPGSLLLLMIMNFSRSYIYLRILQPCS